MHNVWHKRLGAGALLAILAVVACDQDSITPTRADTALAESPARRGGRHVALADHSTTPALLKILEPGVRAHSLLSSDDVLPGSPDFVFGGSADGAGLLENPDGSFTYIVNHEDNFSVSRITLDETFAPVRGEYIVTSDAGQWRLCSATLATPEEHGFGPVFITAGESGIESMIHAIDPFGAPLTSVGSTELLPALGRWNGENAVPLPKQAYAGRTVVVVGDDDSGVGGGQVALYVGRRGDLEGGDLYVMRRLDRNWRERDMRAGERYAVEFVPIEDAAGSTGAEIQAQATAHDAIRFGRVEDIDYRKGARAGREVWFNVTGQRASGVNADESRSVYGRLYRLLLDARTPTRGVLELVLDGDDRSGPAGMFQNPDNLLVTRNYVYVQEDPNGYGDETHDSYVYQYDINKGTLRVVLELDHRRDDPYYGGDSRFGSWEYGAMLDVTDQLGGSTRSGTFLLNIQPHTWRGERYLNPDGGARRASENQASQVVVLTGLPR
jgi:hypothetical protein